MTYQEWIDQVDETCGTCKTVTKKMAEEFPELRRVRGHYHCWIWGKRAHWWLIEPGDEVIDPTADQFPSKGQERYEEWDEGQPEPTGKCLNCGEYCYNGDQVCSERCHVDFLAHLGVS